MKTFHCNACGSLVFFENVKCVKCGHVLGFLPDEIELCALEASEEHSWRPAGEDSGKRLFRSCNNTLQYRVCNWMISPGDSAAFCVSCRLNELIPNLSQPENLERWHKVEIAKRRLLYTILRLGLPMTGAENRPSLRFNFIADLPGVPRPLTGHSNGLIAINVAEADDAERERRRINLHEPYRTLLGHFRHEIGHYYWDRLIAGGKWLADFRKLFGDETADYSAALQRHYDQGPPAEWQARHVSAYATAHPWEDWAETWAHYFHIIDMTETAASYGVTLAPRHPSAKTMIARPRNIFDYNAPFESILENWFPLTYAINAINRGMGLRDAYPFALSETSIEKLKFIHQIAKASVIGEGP